MSSVRSVKGWWEAVEQICDEMKLDQISGLERESKDFQAAENAVKTFKAMAVKGKTFETIFVSEIPKLRSETEKVRKEGFGETEQLEILGKLTLKLAIKYSKLNAEFIEKQIDLKHLATDGWIQRKARSTALGVAFAAAKKRGIQLDQAIKAYGLQNPNVMSAVQAEIANPPKEEKHEPPPKSAATTSSGDSQPPEEHKESRSDHGKDDLAAQQQKQQKLDKSAVEAERAATERAEAERAEAERAEAERAEAERAEKERLEREKAEEERVKAEEERVKAEAQLAREKEAQQQKEEEEKRATEQRQKEQEDLLRQSRESQERLLRESEERRQALFRESDGKRMQLQQEAEAARQKQEEGGRNEVLGSVSDDSSDSLSLSRSENREEQVAEGGESGVVNIGTDGGNKQEEKKGEDKNDAFVLLSEEESKLDNSTRIFSDLLGLKIQKISDKALRMTGVGRGGIGLSKPAEGEFGHGSHIELKFNQDYSFEVLLRLHMIVDIELIKNGEKTDFLKELQLLPPRKQSQKTMIPANTYKILIPSCKYLEFEKLNSLNTSDLIQALSNANEDLKRLTKRQYGKDDSRIEINEGEVEASQRQTKLDTLSSFSDSVDEVLEKKREKSSSKDDRFIRELIIAVNATRASINKDVHGYMGNDKMIFALGLDNCVRRLPGTTGKKLALLAAVFLIALGGVSLGLSFGTSAPLSLYLLGAGIGLGAIGLGLGGGMGISLFRNRKYTAPANKLEQVKNFMYPKDRKG